MAKTLSYYKKLPYRMGLDFDPESDAWVIRYPELPGCTAHGKSPAEAMRGGKTAKELWLESALQEQQDIPEPHGEPTYSGKLVLRLPKSLHESAVESADREGISLNTYLVGVISQGVERSGMKHLIDHLEKFQRQFRIPALESVPSKKFGGSKANRPAASPRQAAH